MDTYDHAVAGDLMQCAAVIASVVYDAATWERDFAEEAVAEGGRTACYFYEVIAGMVSEWF